MYLFDVAVLAGFLLHSPTLPQISGKNLPFERAAMSCKQVSSCEEAVQLWCGGYSRADGDGDGIPCENVCHSRQEVEALMKQSGCRAD